MFADIFFDFGFIGATGFFDIVNFGIDQCAVPPAPQEMPKRSFLSVKEPSWKK